MDIGVDQYSWSCRWFHEGVTDSMSRFHERVSNLMNWFHQGMTNLLGVDGVLAELHPCLDRIERMADAALDETSTSTCNQVLEWTLLAIVRLGRHGLVDFVLNDAFRTKGYEGKL